MKYLVTGAGGMLGEAVMAMAKKRYVDVVGMGPDQLDIADWEGVREALDLMGFDAVINCAGVVRSRTDVDEAEMYRTNAVGPFVLAAWAPRVIQVSTDCVFSGNNGYYRESDIPDPVDAYGITKRMGELGSPHLTVRTSFVGLGRWGLVRWLLDQPQGAEIGGYTTWLWNGFPVDIVAEHLLTLADEPFLSGLIHLGGAPMSKYVLLTQIAAAIRPDIKVVAESPIGKNMVLGGAASYRYWGAASGEGQDFAAGGSYIERFMEQYERVRG